jgi:serine/threonine protein kinase
VHAVKYLHDECITHRDLKLENVVLNQENEPCLVDFGFAVDEQDHSMPKASQVCGTPNYMAPELFDKAIVDAYKTDVWAIGINLYLMHSKGDFPFKGKTPKELKTNCEEMKYSVEGIKDARVQNLLKSIFQLNPKLRPSIEEIC